MTTLTAAIYNCGLRPLRPLERWMAIAATALMCGYAVFRHIDELPIEYFMLAAGMAIAALLLKMQLTRKRVTAAGQPATTVAAGE